MPGGDNDEMKERQKQIDIETRAINMLEKVRVFYTYYLLTSQKPELKKRFSDWFHVDKDSDGSRIGPSGHDRQNLKIVVEKAGWFLNESARLVRLFERYFNERQIKNTHPNVSIMESWRQTMHTVPILFWWMHEYGKTDDFHAWLTKRSESYIGAGRYDLLYGLHEAIPPSWMKPYTEADLRQTFYYLDQLMLDYNHGSKDPDQLNVYEEHDGILRREGLLEYFLVDRRWYDSLKKVEVFDLLKSFKNPRNSAMRTERHYTHKKIRRWHPPGGSREDQSSLGYQNDGTPNRPPPKVAVVEEKKGWLPWPFAESGGAPDACTGNPYHVPLDLYY